jgi:hypothetical protein
MSLSVIYKNTEYFIHLMCAMKEKDRCSFLDSQIRKTYTFILETFSTPVLLIANQKFNKVAYF